MTHTAPTSTDELEAEQQAPVEQDALIEEESLVEEVSIDGMCGVY